MAKFKVGDRVVVGTITARDGSPLGMAFIEYYKRRTPATVTALSSQVDRVFVKFDIPMYAFSAAYEWEPRQYLLKHLYSKVTYGEV